MLLYPPFTETLGHSLCERWNETPRRPHPVVIRTDSIILKGLKNKHFIHVKCTALGIQ